MHNVDTPSRMQNALQAAMVAAAGADTGAAVQVLLGVDLAGMEVMARAPHTKALAPSPEMRPLPA